MIDRRAFLRTTSQSAVAAVGLPLATCTVAGAQNPGQKPPVVDTHMHVWAADPKRYPFPHPYQPSFRLPEAEGTLEMLIADMDANSVTHAILVQVIYHGWDNAYIADCVRTYPKRLRAHGLIDPLDTNVAVKLEEAMVQQGLSGMRFSPIYYKGKDEWMKSQPLHRMWKKAAQLGAVLNFFIGTTQLPILESMVKQYPEVRVIVDHLGQIDLGADDPLPEMKKLIALAQYPNVWVKVSELTSVSKSHTYPFADALPWVKRVYDAYGPDRLLWGTGYPGKARAHYQRPTLDKELSLVRHDIPFFTAEDQRKILGENAVRLWKLTA